VRKITGTLLLGISLCFAFAPAAMADETTLPVTYTVSQGDTLSSIALKNQTTVNQLIQLNQLTDPSRLQIGQKLILSAQPAAAQAAPASTVATPSATEYVVKASDTLSLIAQITGTSSSQIAAANKLTDPSKLFIGQVLIIPPAATTATAPAAKEYVVKASDTLSLIAHITGTSISQIVAANKLTDPSKLFIGQVLIIPAPQATTLASRSDDRRSGSDQERVELLLEYARSLRGKPYSYGSVGPNAYDCSGFTMKVFKQIGISLPHSSAQQSTMGKSVSKSDLLPGDLVFFNTSGSGVSHVGIYVGSNSFIHASTSQGVTITSLGSSYYAGRYMKARRIF